jgi:hypothetical protein
VRPLAQATTAEWIVPTGIEDHHVELGAGIPHLMQNAAMTQKWPLVRPKPFLSHLEAFAPYVLGALTKRPICQ